jgi:arylformamidase
VEILDVTVPIRRGMPVWPGDPEVEIELAASLGAGDPANVTRIALSAHTGTHVDAPLHFLAGEGGVETLPLAALVGPCVVVEADGAGELGPEALAALPAGAERALLKTAGESASLADAAAREVVRRGLRLVGIDTMTIGGVEAHRTLLAAGVVPLEGLDLGRVAPGEYLLVCLPLLLAGADGAPARTVLLRD